jgi:3-methyladenine DNA glycosylase AlkD
MAVGRREERRERFEEFLPLIVSGSGDPRLYVRKAVCWALRQIGKNSLPLNRLAIETAERIGALDSKPARWISLRALSELTSERVAERLGVRGGEAEEF